MQLQTAKQQKHEIPREFFARCRSLAMKAIPKFEDPLLQKFHYDQAQWMLLSTFITGLSGKPGRQVRFQMPATVDLTLQIAIAVFLGRSTGEKIFSIFFNSETPRKDRGNFGQPWKTFGRSECGQATRVSTDAVHVGRKQRQQDVRPTNTSREEETALF